MSAKRAYQLDTNIKKGTLTLAWTGGQTAAETATVNDGWITIGGAYAGKYNNITGQLIFDTNVPADFTASYTSISQGGAKTATAVDSSGFINFDFGQAIDWANQDFILEVEYVRAAGTDVADKFFKKVITKNHAGVHTFATGFKVAKQLESTQFVGNRINYELSAGAGAISVQENVTKQAVNRAWKFAGVTCTLYLPAGEQATTKTFAATDKTVNFRLAPSLPDGAQIEQGSVILKVGNDYLFDRNGELHKNIDSATGSGTKVGTFNYKTTEVNLIDNVDVFSINVISALMQVAVEPVYNLTWFMPQAPLQAASFSVVAKDLNGNEVIGTSNTQNQITGGITGTVDIGQGIYKLSCATGLRPETVRVNGVSIIKSPISSEILNVSTARFPSDGRVRIVRAGDMCVIHNGQVHEHNSAITAGTVITLPRQKLDLICVMDANNKHVLANAYTEDKTAGTVTFSANYNAADYQLPLKIKHVLYDVWVAEKVDNTGKISLKTGGGSGVSRDYPIEGTYVSSAIVKSNLQATVAPVKHLKNWNGDWGNMTGDLPIGRYDDDNHPIVVTSAGAINEIWACEFIGTNDLKIYGKERGVVFEGNTNSDIAPINPATNKPYFTLKAAGFTAGFVVGNVIYFPTTAPSLPVWNVMSTLIGNAPIETDTFAKAYLATTAKES